MANLLPQRASYVCHLCKAARSTAPSVTVFPPTPVLRIADGSRGWHENRRPTKSRARQVRNASTTTGPIARKSPSLASNTSFQQRIVSRPTESSKNASKNTAKTPSPNPIQALSQIRHDASSITSAQKLPDELELQELLNRIFELANTIVFGQAEPPSEDQIDSQVREDTPSSILDELDETASARKVAYSHPSRGMSISFRAKAAETLCEILYQLVRDPKVYISLEILQVYVRVQCLLGKPEYLPEIFHLYANKPIPVPNSSPIRYRNPWPRSPRHAIPMQLSDAALEAAIYKKDLPLCIAITDTTVATPAHKMRKTLIRASPFFGIVATLPCLAYVGALQVAEWQNAWDNNMSIATTMMAATAYIGTFSTIAYIAITTWGDQQDRVVWATATPLYSRWLREEERSYMDRIAQAWGFRDRNKRGEEQGEEWESLRDVLGLRRMVLDKVELMEGMQ